MSYAQIAELLRQKYNLTIQRPAIFKFVKVRSRGRKVYGYTRNAPSEKSTSVLATPQLSDPGSRPPAVAAATTERRSSKFDFQFMPCDRYRLTRLPPEEAAAIRKKLEEKGH